VIDAEEYEEIERILNAAEENESRLTPWEVLFVDGLAHDFGTWGRKTKMSEKQWKILRRIDRRLGDD
jgi:hypothetical protein